MSTITRLMLMVGLGIAPAVFADSSNNTVQTQVSVQGVCQFVDTQDINFGTLSPQDAVNTFAEGGFRFVCTKGMDYRLSIDYGENRHPTTGVRQLHSSANQRMIPYYLDTTGLTGQGNGINQPQIVRITAHILGADYRDAPAGAYADTVRIVFEP